MKTDRKLLRAMLAAETQADGGETAAS
jgi:hypothetical protein